MVTAAEAAVSALTAARAHLADHPDATRIAVRELIGLIADRTLGHRPFWPVEDPPPPRQIRAARRQLADMHTDGWDMNDLGAAYEVLCGHENAAWYTSPELAANAARLSIGPLLEELADDPVPEAVLAVDAVDPACGAGVFLVAALRLITSVFAPRLYGTADPEPAARLLVMPMVSELCVFGMDIDRVAVDLSRAALWLECAGIVPIGWMDDNVVCGDALSGPDAIPPALRDRRAAA